MTAEELFDIAQEHRRNRRFGDAINMYQAAADAPDVTEDIKRKSLASRELIQEINGFVNVDLMNPQGRYFLESVSDTCAGSESASDTGCVEVYSVAEEKAELWTEVNRKLEREPECVLKSNLTYNSKTEMTCASIIT